MHTMYVVENVCGKERLVETIKKDSKRRAEESANLSVEIDSVSPSHTEAVYRVSSHIPEGCKT